VGRLFLPQSPQDLRRGTPRYIQHEQYDRQHAAEPDEIRRMPVVKVLLKPVSHRRRGLLQAAHNEPSTWKAPDQERSSGDFVSQSMKTVHRLLTSSQLNSSQRFREGRAAPLAQAARVGEGGPRRGKMVGGSCSCPASLPAASGLVRSETWQGTASLIFCDRAQRAGRRMEIRRERWSTVVIFV
jgi:hypothetical protein